MLYFVTGVAGFIGYSLSKVLLEKGEAVVGIDSVNDYYSQDLKRARLAELENFSGFKFYHKNLKDFPVIDKIFAEHFDKAKPHRIIHLAAQAGVRYSLENPFAYGESNLDGFLTILEIARKYKPEHFLFASSSSVYGLNTPSPYSETALVDAPISLYAATKKSNELMAHAYSHLYKIPTTGLRFFTVYGPFGRPDMAYFKFAKLISEDKAIDVYNNGNLMRDFTYIDDVVQAILLLADKPPKEKPKSEKLIQNGSSAAFEIYNIGNENPEKLLDFISLLENHLGKQAEKNFLPMQPGDVYLTSADNTKLFNAISWKPKTSLDEGLKKFAEWFKKYYKKF
ncbi:MAG: GDP-mannose 4,6-dehydratase [Treponemataceae bacterium]